MSDAARHHHDTHRRRRRQSELHDGGEVVPRPMLIAVAALMAFSLAAAGLGRLTATEGPRPVDSTPVASMQITFADQADGSIDVVRATDGVVVDTLAPGTNGFVRGALRGLVRQRRLHDAGSAVPFELTRWENGKLSLTDPATGERLFLSAFGPTNRDAFAQILSKGSAKP
jgi:putative photosynthetic complex assembly protein